MIEADDGATGLDAFTHLAMSPDIVLVDWAMPAFDGLKLTRMIRETEGALPTLFVPIIMITGHSERNRVMLARDAGITEFLAKPISAKVAVSSDRQRRRRIRGRSSRPGSYFGPDRRRNTNPNAPASSAEPAARAQLSSSSRPRSALRNPLPRRAAPSTKEH